MVKPLLIKDPDKLARVLSIFSELDRVRWSHTTNYNLINHCTDDLTPDEKLLSHWLCYITDRQTAFERVWEVGGYVLSHLVRSFTRDGKTPAQTMLDHLRAPTEKSGLRLECPLATPSTRLAHYDIYRSPVEFASRFMPSDTISIYRTLIILDAVAQRNFTRFMYQAVQGQSDQLAAVRRLAVALHFLTYAQVGKVAAEDLSGRIASMPTDIQPQIAAYQANTGTFLTSQEKEFKPHEKKRLWCSIRDYLKSPEFNTYLVDAMKAVAPSEATRWRKDTAPLRTALAVIELPGDVWNNNRIFRDGLFTPSLGTIPKTWNMPQTVRAIHDMMPAGKTNFYPEQLDVTFDFVPRMCDMRNCHICMFGQGVARLCHGKPDLYCPVTLAACGYVHPCDPANCTFKGNVVAGLCRSAIPAGY